MFFEVVDVVEITDVDVDVDVVVIVDVEIRTISTDTSKFTAVKSSLTMAWGCKMSL